MDPAHAAPLPELYDIPSFSIDMASPSTLNPNPTYYLDVEKLALLACTSIFLSGILDRIFF